MIRSTRPQRMMATLLATALPLAGCASTPRPAAQGVPVGDRAARADAAIQAAMTQGPFPGVAVAVSRNGRMLYSAGFGAMDRESGAPVGADTRFPIGSITKPVTCLSVLQLADKGRIDLDATAGRYLTDLPVPARDVTVRQLLDHSAGVPNYLENPDFPYSKPVGLSRKDMLGYFAGKPLRYPAGTQFNYSNSDTYLLGLIVEAASGVDYDRYVIDHIFRPFGMARSDFGADPNHAKGYQSRAGAYRSGTVYDWLVPFSAGAIVSTGTDLVRFSEGLFGKATPDTVRRMALTGGALGDGTPNSYRQGCLIAGDLDGRPKYSHAGSIYGFSSHFAYYPDDRLTVIVLTNSQGENFPALTLEHRIARIFLDLREPDMTGLPLDTAESGWIVGDYVVTNRRLGFDRIGIVLKDGMLQLSYGGRRSGAAPVPLIRLGAGRFASSADPEQILRFTRDANGEVALSLRYYEGDFPMRKLPD